MFINVNVNFQLFPMDADTRMIESGTYSMCLGLSGYCTTAFLLHSA